MKLICHSLKDYSIAAEKMLTNYPLERVFAFYGKMGAGKTTFIQAISKYLGATDIPKSPTFSIINEYFTKTFPKFKTLEKAEKIYHFDFYRIQSEEEAYDIGYEEYFYSNNYCFIEWAERIERLLPTRYVKIEIEELENQERTISCSLVK